MSLEKALKNQLGDEWYYQIGNEFKKPYMSKLSQRVAIKRNEGVVYPDSQDVFKAFKLTPYNIVRVVLIGQDPYPNGYADGLAFSSAVGWECPQSLQQILYAIEEQVYNGLDIPLWNRYDLNHLADQGVLLLNTRLTVDKDNPGSHTGIGWEIFISQIIKVLNTHSNNIVFLLMGSSAKQFHKFINKKKHEIIMTEHPAAASYKGSLRWNSNNCFSKINNFLKNNNGNNSKEQIKWSATEYYEGKRSN